MKPDYKNWMPRGMILSFAGGAAVALAGAALAGGLMSPGGLKTAAVAMLSIAGAALAGVSLWCRWLYRAFDYGGKRQMSRHIIEGVASRVHVPEGGKCLDVGCGSGALAIAVAKGNSRAEVVGVDRWGKEYASFSKALCEKNAAAEGVGNIRFARGDACGLEFADESFDAVVSNYVYHNIPSKDRQAILLETLRVLKKGGCFALHDIFSKGKYGDMDAFVQKLKDMGYEEVELIDTANGLWIGRGEARLMGLSGSALLVGVKR